MAPVPLWHVLHGKGWVEFYLDDVLKHSISGEVDWQQKSYNVTGAGSHTLKWRYVKDSSASDGSDCGWVDCLQWSGYIPVAVPTVWDAISYTYDPAGRRIAKAYDETTIVKLPLRRRPLHRGIRQQRPAPAEVHPRPRPVDEPICDLMPPLPAWQPFVPHRSSGRAPAAGYN